MGYDWFVIHSKGWLTGSIRAQLTPAERGVWADLLALANESRVEGIVCMAKGIPYEREYLADILRIPVDLLNSTIDKCIKDENADDPRTRIMLDGAGCLIIANWEKYQPKARKVKREEDKPPLTEKALDEMNVQRQVEKPELTRKGATLQGKAVLDTTTGEIQQDQSVLDKQAEVKERNEALGKLKDRANFKG